MRTHPSLAGIEQRTAEATEGPWNVVGPSNPGPWNELAIIPLGEVGAVAYVQPQWDDAEFIADARTDIPALTAAVRDVLALHRAVEVEPSDTICAGCSTLRGAGESLRYFPVTEYPCETVRALAIHLDLTDPEGEPS